MYPNSTHILLKDEQEPMLLEKHHIMETELVLPEVRRQVPSLEWFFDSQLVFGGLRDLLPSWLGLSGYMIKLQYNKGHGGCFPMHFDTYGDDGKCLTAVLYLNENWQEGDGGEIVVYPFPRKEPVTIRPLDGDLVLFSSQQMLHRVMPAIKPRFCLTTWMYQAHSNATDPARNAFYQPEDQEPNYLSDVLHKVMRSSFRRHLAKLYYHEEWSRSLQQSHQQTSAFEKYADTQEREVQVIKDATTKMLHNFRVKDKKQPSTLPQSSEALLEKITTDDQYRQILSKMPIPWF
ncbi:hypothetical protein Poli38472_004094 [Pythium oligandrum]|uniref:Fe2OG dioxygenase domain-containing protein n=1 Tax=Pythium oligandrum TaxID=41045 RepID=A0A8K1FMJ2_PYTOL|nr:hypothetical protein Poli38472_004094 [Pythium oligandrum]|eukprot:TMW66329.1 hypothetical protein Poli38472_004094 [Pythium oligandrum]